MLIWQGTHAGSQHRAKEEAFLREDAQLHANDQAAHLRHAIHRIDSIDPKATRPMNRRHVHLRVSWTSTNSKKKHGDVHLYDGGFTFRSSGIELGRGLRPWDWYGSTKSCDRRGGLQRYFDHSASLPPGIPPDAPP